MINWWCESLLNHHERHRCFLCVGRSTRVVMRCSDEVTRGVERIFDTTLNEQFLFVEGHFGAPHRMENVTGKSSTAAIRRFALGITRLAILVQLTFLISWTRSFLCQQWTIHTLPNLVGAACCVSAWLLWFKADRPFKTKQAHIL